MIHSYACQVLKKKGIKIYAGGKRILDQDYNKLHPKIVTRIKKKSDFQRHYLADGGIKKIYDLDQLRELGFKLIKCQASGEYFKMQKIAYKIVRNNFPLRNPEMLVQSMPLDSYIEYDLVNQCLRGIGRNFDFSGKSQWVSIQVQENNFKYEKKETLNLDYNLNYARGQFFKNSVRFKKEEYLDIPEGVLGLSEQGDLVCMAKPNKNNMPFIIIIGGKGTGKSLTLNNIEGNTFDENKFDCSVININDIAPEGQTRCLEWNECEMKRELNRFGENSVPRPIVYLHPTTNTEYSILYENEVGFKITVPFREVMIDKFILDYNEAWVMPENSKTKFNELIRSEGELRLDGLAFKRGLKESLAFIEREVNSQGVREKIQMVIKDIYNSKISDVSSGVSSKWVMERNGMQEADSPWIIAIKSGLLPYINTSGIRYEPWFALWLRYIISDLMRYVKKTNMPLLITSDEVAPLLKNKATKDIIEEAIRECRKMGAGFGIVSHRYGDVPEAIRLHADYLFVFRTNEDEVMKKMKEYGLSKDQCKEIANLKKFQCYAVGDFILYDASGNKYSNDGKPVKIIRIKPPNALHRA